MSLTNLKLRNVEARPLTFQEGDDNIKILASASIASMSYDSSSISLIFHTYPAGSGSVAFSSSLSSMTSSFETASHFIITGSSFLSGSLVLTGSIELLGTASINVISTNKLITNEFTSSTTFISTGSNVFGDDLSDIQQFTGSVEVTGSITVKGPLKATGSVTFSGSHGTDLTSILTDTRIGYISNSNYLSSSINMTGSVKITGSFSVNGNDISFDSVIDTGSATVTQFISGTLNLVGDGLGAAVMSVSESKITVSSSLIEITGSTFTSGSTFINNRLVVTGSTILSSSIEIIGTTRVTGSSYFGKDVNISGSLSHSGSVGILSDRIDISSSLITITSSATIVSSSTTLFGTSSLVGINTISGSTNISGSVIHSGSLSFYGTSSFSGSTTINGDLYALTTASFEGPFESKNNNKFGTLSSSQHQFTGSVNISGSLTVNGDAISFAAMIDTGSVDSNQFISGSLLTLANDGTSLFVSSSGIILSGSTYISGSTKVNGNTEITGSTIISGSTKVSGDTEITGSTNISGSTTITGSVNVNGISEFTSSIFAVSSSNFVIQVSGSSGSWNSGLIVKGLAETASANILVYDNISNVVSYTSKDGLGFPYTGSAGISGSLLIDGNLTSLAGNSALEVTGSTHFSGSVTINNSTTLSGSTVISGSVTVNNSTVLSGSTDISGSLNVNNSTTLSGSTVITGSVLTSGSLTVSGSTEFTGSVGVTGSVEVSNHISASVLYPSGTVGFFGTASQAITSSYVIGQSGFITTGSNGLVQIITGSIVITGSATGSNGEITASDMLITNRLTVFELFTQYITSSTTVNTGSNIFGDSLNDTHEFTGSVRITGSLSLDKNTYFIFGSPGTIEQWRFRPAADRLYVEYSNDTGSTWNDSIWFEAQV